MADHVHRETVEARIQHIMRMMTSLDDRGAIAFKRGRTARELAEQWGLSEETVFTYTQEASKRVRAAMSDTHSIMAQATVALDEVIQRGLSGDNSPAMLRAVTDAVKTAALITGAMAPQKIEVTGEATPERARALIAAQFKSTPHADSAEDAGDTPEGSPSE